MMRATMALPATVETEAARRALGDVVPRLVALVRSIRDPQAPALGEWNAADVAMHLAHVWEVLPSLVAGEREPFLGGVEELAGLTTSLVRGEEGRDLEEIAARIERGAAAYLATPIPEETARPWMVRGSALPPSSFACHMLNESLVHGFDVARSQGLPWRIDPAYAGMAILGFLFPALSVVDPRFPVRQEKAAGVHASFDIRVRGAGSVHMLLQDGALTITPPGPRRVDCHLSGEATTLFLLIWGRTGQWRGVLTGRLLSWGRRPWLAARLPSMLRNP